MPNPESPAEGGRYPWPPIGENLARLRKQADLTQEELAELSGVSVDLIKRLEQGRRVSARLDSLYRLTSALDAPLAALFAPDQDAGLTGDDLDRLCYAVRWPRRLDPRAVEALGVVLAAQRSAEDAIGAAPLVQPVSAQLVIVEHLVSEARGRVRGQLVEVAAQWAQYAGWLHATTGHLDAARAAWQQALAWATEAGDAQMAGTVLSWHGWIAEHTGELSAMVSLAAAAQRSRSAPGRTYDLYQQARGYALTGQAAEAVRLLDAAGAAVAGAEPSQARPWEYYYLAPGFWDLEHGLTLLVLGRHDPKRAEQAVGALARGLAALPAGMRASDWAGEYRYHLARAYAQASAPELACREAAGAVRVARATGAARLLERLRGLHASLSRRWPSYPAVAELGGLLGGEGSVP